MTKMIYLFIVVLLLPRISLSRYTCDTTFQNNDTTVVCSTFNEDGQVISVESYKDGKLHGNRISWYANGQLKRISPYSNGKRIDTSFSYHSNGGLNIRGVQNGITIVLSESGDTLAITPMCDGKLCGISKGWYPDGLLKSITHYNSSGQKHGLSEEWREDGTRKDSIVYDNGDIIEVRRYFENGKLHYHKYQKPVNRDINAVYYDPKCKKAGEIKNGTGVFIDYSPDGKSAEKVYMENDEVVKIEKIEME